MHGDLIKGIRHIAGDRPIAILPGTSAVRSWRLTKPVKGKPGEIVEIDLPPSCEKGRPGLPPTASCISKSSTGKHSR